MSDYKAQKRMKKFAVSLKKDLFAKCVIIPTIFVVLTIVICLVLTNPSLDILFEGDGISTTYSATEQLNNENSTREAV